MSYTNIFGQNVVNPAFLSYIKYSIIVSTTPLVLTWPTQFVDSANNASAIIELTADAAGYKVTMPDAQLVSTGQAVLLVNVGAETITINLNDGTTLLSSLAAGVSTYAYLTDNSTVNGTWTQIPWGGGYAAVVSVAAASSSNNLTITGSPITNAGTFTFDFALDLSVLSSFAAGTGIPARTAANTWSLRTITGTGNQVAVTNGAGIAGNPILSFPSAVIFPGTVTLNADAATALEAVTLQQLNAVAPGRQFKDSVRAKTTAALTSIYANGTAGVGATLTNSAALATLSLDGTTMVNGDRVLINSQAVPAENGIYDVTAAGDGATAWVLTRSADFDTPAEMQIGSNVLVMEGTANILTSWALGAAVTTIGTDAVTFLEFTYNLTYPTLTVTGALTNNNLTASRAVATDANSILTSSTTTAAELDFVSGASSNIQVQIDALSSSTLFSNLLLNSNFQVAQLGTSFTAATVPINSDDTYLLDQWVLLSDGNDVVDVTQDTADAPVGAGYCAKSIVQTANKKFGFIQFLENKRSIAAIGETASVSFQAKINAGNTTLDAIKCTVLSWDSTADVLTSDVVNAWGIDGVTPTFVANWTEENVAAATVLTAAWQTITINAISIDTASTTNVAVFIYIDNGDATGTDELFLSTAQLLVSSAVSPYSVTPFDADLQACLRFLEKSFPYATAPAQSGGVSGQLLTQQGVGASTATQSAHFLYSVIKRIVPGTVTLYNPAAANVQARNQTTATDCSGTLLSANYANGFTFSYTTAAGTAIPQSNALHYLCSAQL